MSISVANKLYRHFCLITCFLVKI